jgi:hypothetical protein
MTILTKSVFDMLQRSEMMVTPLHHLPYLHEIESHAIYRTLRVHPTYSSRMNLCLDMYNSSTIPEGFSSSVFNLLYEFVQSRVCSIGERNINITLGILTFAHQMARATSFLDYATAMEAFCSRFDYKIVSLFDDLDVWSIFRDSAIEGDLEPHGASNIVDSWRLLKSNPIFPKLSVALGCLSIIPLCYIESTKVDISVVQLLKEKFTSMHLKSIDIVDAVLESFSWVLDTGFAVIKTRSLSPLLYSDQAIREFNSKFQAVDAMKSNAINGSHPNIAQYRSDLDDCIRLVEKFMDCKLDFVMRRYLHDKYNVLISIKDSLAIKDRNCTMRFCPIGFSLYGGTGVGKTTLGKLTMITSLSSMGFSTEDKFQITLDMHDKYHSTLTNDIEGIFFDDLANTKANFAQNGQVPSNTIIKFFNNVPGQAVKADVDDKGKVFISLKCGIVTTNKKDLDAPIYSNCPESILRRLYHVTVRVKPQYCKVVNNSTTSLLDPLHPDLQNQTNIGSVDVWLLDIEVIESYSSGGFSFAVYKHKMKDGSTLICKDLSLYDYLTVVSELSIAHKASQDKLLNGSRVSTITCCPSHGFPFSVCKCQGLDYGTLFTRILGAFGYLPIEYMSNDDIFSKALNVVDFSLLQIVPYIPEIILRRSFVQDILNISSYRLAQFDAWYINAFYDNRWKSFWYIYTVWALMSTYIRGFSIGRLILQLISTFILLQFFRRVIYGARIRRARKLLDAVNTNRGALTAYSQHLRDISVPRYIVMGGALVTLVYALKYIYKVSLTPEGDSLSPESIAKQPSWQGNVIRGISGFVQNTTQRNRSSSQMCNLIRSNIFYCTFTRDDGSQVSCCLFMPKKGLAFIPKHIFHPECDMTTLPRKTMQGVAIRSPSPGGTISFCVSLDACIVRDDLCCFHIPGLPDVGNIMDTICDNFSGAGYGEIVKRDASGNIHSESIYLKHGLVGHKYMKFQGSSYHTDIGGLGTCMAPIISNGNPCGIVGLHIAGSPGISTSVALTKGIVSDMETELNKRLLLVPCCSGELDPEALTSFGRKHIVGPTHPNAHCHSLPNDTTFRALGMTKVGAQMKSEVEKSLLYDSVLAHFPIVDNWKAPEMRPNWLHYNAFIDKVVRPSLQFDPIMVNKAIVDYLSPLRTKTTTYYGIRRPLTFQEAIDGIPGMRFIDPLIMKTSMGFPIFGAKNKYFNMVEENGIVTRIPDACIIEEYERLLKCYKNKKRGYPVFTACLKDEVKEKESQKVRVFTAASVAHSILIRKYFLPLIAFLGFHPIEAEMAVGVNAFGLQWQDLMDYTERFDTDGDGNIGMDYSAYDTRMNSQMSRSAYAILIQLASDLGYDRDSLDIMEYMIDDLTHPLVDINGTLYALQHINCSGNNVTVQINCIVNSLYLRVAFFSLTNKANFREFVSLITYGDDNKGSVHPQVRSDFNFLTLRSFLAQHDIKITPPDKNSIHEEPFFPLYKLDFLKRQSNFIPEINRKIGRLEEDSIFKSLCYNVASSSTSKKDVAASCIDSALHEWFAHGREHFEMRRRQLIECCKDVGMVNYDPLNISFDQRVELWLKTYMPEV